jgi:hypothetical protein
LGKARESDAMFLETQSGITITTSGRHATGVIVITYDILLYNYPPKKYG